MGSVYVGIQRGAAGFKRPVAIKRAHPHLLDDPQMRDTILSEARNASVVRHPNVVSVDDVEETDGELLLVMDYVEGTSLSHILSARGALDPDVVVRVMLDACAALNAIHIAKNENGEPLGLIHRDVSPQNILIDTDGIARVTDFGIAKAARDPKGGDEADPPGKLGYMAPEYLKGARFSPQSDIFGLGVVLWESLTGKNLFRGETPVDSLRLTLDGYVPLVRSIIPKLPGALDDVLARCLAIDPEERFENVRDLADALEDLIRPAGRDQVAEVVMSVASATIAEHRKAINLARISGRPPREEPSFDADEGNVPFARLVMPEILTIDVSAPEPPTFVATDPAETGSRKARAMRSSRTSELLSAAAQKPRTKGMIALGLALVTLVISTTALIVSLGTGDDPITPRATDVNVTSGEVQ